MIVPFRDAFKLRTDDALLETARRFGISILSNRVCDWLLPILQLQVSNRGLTKVEDDQYEFRNTAGGSR